MAAAPIQQNKQRSEGKHMTQRGGGLEIRWRVQSSHGRLVVSVRVDDGVYIAALVRPPLGLADVLPIAGSSADAVLDAMIVSVGGSGLLPIGARPSNRY